MAARGSIAKEEIKSKILTTFEGSFENGKELRIPMQENGETVEIKITMVCAKDIVGGGVSVSASTLTQSETGTEEAPPWASTEPTEEEKSKVEDLLNQLNL